MHRYIITIIYFSFILFTYNAAAQDELSIAEAKEYKTVTILSLDGKSEKINFKYLNHTLLINSSKDEIRIGDYWGITPEIHMLNKNFVEMHYAVRGGSGVGLGNTLILCINKGKLYEAMHVLSYSNGEDDDVKSDYHLKLFLNGVNKNDYRLNINIHDSYYSKNRPEESYNYDNLSVLQFDTKHNAFYSIKEGLYNCYIPKTKEASRKQKIAGTFPMIILGKETYYYINNRWYGQENSKRLYEFQ